jgi:hypothetical protein
MSKTAETSILTANRLSDGVVVFLDFEGAWSESIAEAVLARSPDEARALQDRGTYDAARNVIVEPYLVEVRETAGGVMPVRYRERVRAGGPSILEDVPGYTAPSPRASSTTPRTPSAPGEGWGEGRPQATTQSVSAPHPNPLPASGERGQRPSGERETHAQAA